MGHWPVYLDCEFGKCESLTIRHLGYVATALAVYCAVLCENVRYGRGHQVPIYTHLSQQCNC